MGPGLTLFSLEQVSWSGSDPPLVPFTPYLSQSYLFDLLQGVGPRAATHLGLPPNYVPHVKLEVKYLFLLGKCIGRSKIAAIGG
jgi:hypothetical protein